MLLTIFSAKYSIRYFNFKIYFLFKTIIEPEFGIVLNDLFENKKVINSSNLKNICFGDFIKTKDDKRSYDEIEDLTILKANVEQYLIDHNASSKIPLDLVTKKNSFIYIFPNYLK